MVKYYKFEENAMHKESNQKEKLRELCKSSLEIEALYKIFHHLLLTDNDDAHLFVIARQ